MDNHCSPDLELLVVNNKPSYLPREFTAVFILALYVLPDANAAVALDTLAKVINKPQCAHPDGVLVIAGDFNHVNLRSAFQGFHQFVKWQPGM